MKKIQMLLLVSLLSTSFLFPNTRDTYCNISYDFGCITKVSVDSNIKNMLLKNGMTLEFDTFNEASKVGSNLLYGFSIPITSYYDDHKLSAGGNDFIVGYGLSLRQPASDSVFFSETDDDYCINTGFHGCVNICDFNSLNTSEKCIYSFCFLLDYFLGLAKKI